MQEDGAPPACMRVTTSKRQYIRRYVDTTATKTLKVWGAGRGAESAAARPPRSTPSQRAQGSEPFMTHSTTPNKIQQHTMPYQRREVRAGTHARTARHQQQQQQGRRRRRAAL